jgi:DNA-directed RNA polymerase specialized sigma24 family protein
VNELSTQNPLASGELPAEAEDVIRRIVRFKLRTSGAALEDGCQEARLQLLERLRAMPSAAEENLPGLAATIAWRVCAQQVRQKNPQFQALRNRIQYLLTRQAGLAGWRQSNEAVAGFAVWQEARPALRAGQLRSLLADRQWQWQAQNLRAPQGSGLAELLTAIFNQAAAPVRLNELVMAVAEILQITEPQIVTADKAEWLDALPSTEPDLALQVEKRLFLQRMWEEIQLLPVHQRAALLLNLRDETGRGCIALFLITGTASLRKLAEVLAISAERFAAIWNDLPLEDQIIAELSGQTRQQVINARKSARERLARRLRGFA